ncbi:hypothetical protein E3N88_11601 [Mikania micrantha]|uniref:Uncharacterized protein n=1 Tax=Mikania micrantha TaxID=192012 RepID=A0A5N6PDV6_9ASTR|nr:hypothetical protein E3N88_11601 [Mikania micrantha]
MPTTAGDGVTALVWWLLKQKAPSDEERRRLMGRCTVVGSVASGDADGGGRCCGDRCWIRVLTAASADGCARWRWQRWWMVLKELAVAAAAVGGCVMTGGVN